MTHPTKEQTLVLFKPDALQRSILGQVLIRFENKGLRIAGVKMIHLSDEVLSEHYAHHRDKAFFEDLKSFMRSAPVLAIVLEGIDAVRVVRVMVGSTSGRDAQPGTIRGDFSISRSANLIHSSDSLDTAREEVARFFSHEELFEYEKVGKEFIYDTGELA